MDYPATDQDRSWTFTRFSFVEKFGDVSKFSQGGVHQGGLFRIWHRIPLSSSRSGPSPGDPDRPCPVWSEKGMLKELIPL